MTAWAAARPFRLIGWAATCSLAALQSFQLAPEARDAWLRGIAQFAFDPEPPLFLN
jgi:hypothetical protein